MMNGGHGGWKKKIATFLFCRAERWRLHEDEVMHQQWLDSLKPGDLVCDCRFRHLKIVSRDGDDVLLSDGSSCSLSHCCDPADHVEPHPEEEK